MLPHPPSPRPSRLRPARIGLLACSVLSGSAHAQICADLRGHWSFNATLADQSGNGRDAQAIGSSLVAGVDGQALRTDWASGTYAEVAHHVSLNPSTGITVAAWVKDAIGRIGNDAIVDKGATSHSAPFYQYHLGIGGDFIFDLAINGTRRTVRGGTNTQGVWQFVAGTYDGTTLRLYIDGSLAASTTAVGTISGFGRPLRFGRFSNLATSTDATIDEVRVYGRALSPAEVEFLFASPSGQPFISPATARVCPATQATLTAQAGGGPGLAHVWQFAHPAAQGGWATIVEGTNLDPLTGAPAFDAFDTSTPTLRIARLLGDRTTLTLRAVVTGPCGALPSAQAQVTLCSADFNCDGTPDPDDLSDYIACFFSTPPCDLADFDANGTVDPDDLSDYIAAFFGPAC